MSRPTPPSSCQRYELATADREIASAHLFAAGALGVWEQADRLVAWFPDRDRPVPLGGHWSEEPDRDWQAAWKATIAPVRAGRFTVVPSWLLDGYDRRADETVLVIDPGRAFGTGHHATTCLCLELLDGLALAGRTVLDVGTGSGVLAIAAGLRGAQVTGVDIDPDAVAVARDNALRNRVEVELRVGGVEAVDGSADVVVANLVTDVLVSLAAPLAAATRDLLVVSGVAAERRTRVEDALAGCGMVVEAAHERDGWVALAGVHRG